MRTLRLVRHAEALDTNAGKRQLTIGARTEAGKRGKRFRNQGYDLSVMGISHAIHVEQTARAMGKIKQEHPIDPELIKYSFLNEIVVPDLTRTELTSMLRNGSAPDNFEEIGNGVIEDLSTIDERIQLCVTHGTILAAIQVALINRGEIVPSPSQPSLIVHNLGSLVINC